MTRKGTTKANAIQLQVKKNQSMCNVLGGHLTRAAYEIDIDRERFDGLHLFKSHASVRVRV